VLTWVRPHLFLLARWRALTPFFLSLNLTNSCACSKRSFISSSKYRYCHSVIVTWLLFLRGSTRVILDTTSLAFSCQMESTKALFSRHFAFWSSLACKKSSLVFSSKYIYCHTVLKTWMLFAAN